MTQEERRRFLNMMISQMDQEYLRAVVSYNRLLRQRNSLLKQDNVPDILLDTVSERMYGLAEYIYRARNMTSEMLNERAASFYSLISDGKEAVEIRYRSDTTAGVQRDDLELFMDGYPVRRCSSQGQQKSFLLALKMAQYSVMRQVSGLQPILLFDDLFDKLDAGRVASLIDIHNGHRRGPSAGYRRRHYGSM